MAKLTKRIYILKILGKTMQKLNISNISGKKKIKTWIFYNFLAKIMQKFDILHFACQNWIFYNFLANIMQKWDILQYSDKNNATIGYFTCYSHVYEILLSLQSV